MTTAISRDDVLHLAQLSNLQLSEDEIMELCTDISKILEYVQQLGELDTEGIEPTYQLTDLENIYRDDKVKAGAATRDQLLNLAPDKTMDQMKVPKVL